MAGGLLQERGAVVTGAAQGIGLAIARVFCAQGARVVIGDRDADAARAAADTLTAEGGTAVASGCDVT
ncbi:MAG: SDR family NAD(P)-dependent oxidoreductase, partial [Streptomycetaceae bacterium]|nr:SDR family NAD(P)-dependent oxidoreductase [Streptomycetaceae bacterium]